ncbi:hypothetical protein ONS95_009251 [Cadophora gregata]|uniref:uncharacterized protein n=1 Tax=Cadophora gregata TaxID=51156 RepID=UPI0026DC4646|nr:uncharacterized protein ONS95_009251 [Cadophora gregata]KAK0124279.1 hypothetical protein ONS95_009251 [Cadophora gregata]
MLDIACLKSLRALRCWVSYAMNLAFPIASPVSTPLPYSQITEIETSHPLIWSLNIVLTTWRDTFRGLLPAQGRISPLRIPDSPLRMPRSGTVASKCQRNTLFPSPPQANCKTRQQRASTCHENAPPSNKPRRTIAEESTSRPQALKRKVSISSSIQHIEDNASEPWKPSAFRSNIDRQQNMKI